MSVIKASAIRDDFLKKPPNGIPIILISPSSRVLRKIKEADFIEFSLNQSLAEMLLEIPDEKRVGVVMEKIQKLLMEQGPAVLIKDFEMLFDPRYQIDVLKLFCDLSRQRRIAVLWCGTFRENRLEFSEPGFADFQSYNIDQYTLYCVQ